jgi:CheY-like chemotaxis protein
MFYLRASDKRLALLGEYATDVPQNVRADESKLRQVLINLLSNAVKFTHEGGVTLRARCTELDPTHEKDSFRGDPLSDTPRAWIHFEIEDTGIGIAPEDLKGLFDPFVQTTGGQGAKEGTGLGLPISRQFVRLMGGDITVSSVLGQGSTFKFDVQVELTEASDIHAERPARRVIALEPGQPVYRVLVAEDRKSNRDLLVKLLTSLGSSSGDGHASGFEVRSATNGQEAVDIWQEWDPHLIWMDMRMPVMDGHEATRRIKSTPKGQSTIIVALTASAFEEDRRAVLADGCDDFVRKPFREAEIFEKLSEHLGVQYVYEDAADQQEQGEDVLSPQSVAALPTAWVAELYQAASQADGGLVLGLVERIRTEQAQVADALADLVQKYRFDMIVDLIRASRNGTDE